VTNEEIKKLLAAARCYAVSQRKPDLADDFAQEAYLAYARGRKATLEQLFIDLLRKEYGDTRPSRAGAGPRGRARFVSLDQPPAPGDDGLLLHERLGRPGGDPEPERLTRGSGIYLVGRDALIHQAAFEEEMPRREIAAQLGITESRVSQIIKARIKPAIERAYVLQEAWDLYHDDPDYSKLQVGWMKL